MADHATGTSTRFLPRRPASRALRATAFVIGGLLWPVALLVVAWLVDQTNAIGVGLAIAAASFLLAVVALVALRQSRLREVRGYEAGR